LSTESKPVIPIEKPYLYGFGGWLYLFAAGLIYQFYKSFGYIEDGYNALTSEEMKPLMTIGSESYNSFWKPTFIFEIIGQSLSIVGILLIAYYCFKLSPKFKYLSISYFIFLFIFNCIDLFLSMIIQNGYSEDIFGGNHIYSSVISTAVTSAIWIPYFLVSKRVKNTYSSSSAAVFERSTTPASSFLAGTAMVVLSVLTISNYLAIVTIYFWSSYIGYLAHGFWGTILTLFIPGFSQLYWLYVEWGDPNGNMAYVYLCLLTIASYVVTFVLASIVTNKTK